jgi:hypothetical protein
MKVGAGGSGKVTFRSGFVLRVNFMVIRGAACCFIAFMLAVDNRMGFFSVADSSVGFLTFGGRPSIPENKKENRNERNCQSHETKRSKERNLSNLCEAQEQMSLFPSKEQQVPCVVALSVYQSAEHSPDIQKDSF